MSRTCLDSLLIKIANLKTKYNFRKTVLYFTVLNISNMVGWAGKARLDTVIEIILCVQQTQFSFSLKTIRIDFPSLRV